MKCVYIKQFTKDQLSARTTFMLNHLATVNMFDCITMYMHEKIDVQWNLQKLSR